MNDLISSVLKSNNQSTNKKQQQQISQTIVEQAFNQENFSYDMTQILQSLGENETFSSIQKRLDDFYINYVSKQYETYINEFMQIKQVEVSLPVSIFEQDLKQIKKNQAIIQKLLQLAGASQALARYQQIRQVLRQYQMAVEIIDRKNKSDSVLEQRYLQQQFVKLSKKLHSSFLSNFKTDEIAHSLIIEDFSKHLQTLQRFKQYEKLFVYCYGRGQFYETFYNCSNTMLQKQIKLFKSYKKVQKYDVIVLHLHFIKFITLIVQQLQRDAVTEQPQVIMIEKTNKLNRSAVEETDSALISAIQSISQDEMEDNIEAFDSSDADVNPIAKLLIKDMEQFVFDFAYAMQQINTLLFQQSDIEIQFLLRLVPFLIRICQEFDYLIQILEQCQCETLKIQNKSYQTVQAQVQFVIKEIISQIRLKIKNQIMQNCFAEQDDWITSSSVKEFNLFHLNKQTDCIDVQYKLKLIENMNLQNDDQINSLMLNYSFVNKQYSGKLKNEDDILKCDFKQVAINGKAPKFFVDVCNNTNILLAFCKTYDQEIQCDFIEKCLLKNVQTICEQRVGGNEFVRDQGSLIIQLKILDLALQFVENVNEVLAFHQQQLITISLQSCIQMMIGQNLNFSALLVKNVQKLPQKISLQMQNFDAILLPYLKIQSLFKVTFAQILTTNILKYITDFQIQSQNSEEVEENVTCLCQIVQVFDQKVEEVFKQYLLLFVKVEHYESMLKQQILSKEQLVKVAKYFRGSREEKAKVVEILKK